jgi:hypothetical protein
MVLAEREPILRHLEAVLEPVDLGLQLFLAFAGFLKLLLHDTHVVLLQVRALDLPGERRDVAVPDAVLECPGEAAFEHLGKAAQLLLVSSAC